MQRIILLPKNTQAKDNFTSKNSQAKDSLILKSAAETGDKKWRQKKVVEKSDEIEKVTQSTS